MQLTSLEDLIIDVCNPINGFDKELLAPRDRSILYSMASQLKKSIALTENQASLAVKIIRDNNHIYKTIEGLDSFLNNPKYKNPFRIVDWGRKIFLHSNETIGIKFPFNASFIKLLEKIPSRKIFDTSTKSHTYKLTEDNIYRIVELFSSQEFDIDPIIYSWYQEIVKIRNHLEEFIPTADIVDNQIEILNCNRIAETYFNENKTDNLISNAILCKKMGLNFTKSFKDYVSALDINPYIKKILFHDKYHSFVRKSEMFNNKSIAELIKEINNYPILFFMSETPEFSEDFENLIANLNAVGIENKDMSVLFRSDYNNKFNQFIKDNDLNNFYNEDTKIVFLKYKIPKFLYKLSFNPSMIISNSLLYVHYTAQKMIESHPLVLYYTEESGKSLGTKIAKL